VSGTDPGVTDRIDRPPFAWVVSVRPSLRISALYFVAERAIYLLLAPAFRGAKPRLRRYGANVRAIASAAAFSSTAPGRGSRRWPATGDGGCSGRWQPGNRDV